MRFFCVKSELKGTCYHEFQKGEWEEGSFWKEDSLYLHDDVLRSLKLYKVFQAVNPDYTDYGETKMDKNKWNQVLRIADVMGGDVKAAVEEAHQWVIQVWKTEANFTILGI